MTEERPPQRVRITAPPRRLASTRPHNRLGDVHEQTEMGGIYLRSLLREQMVLAGRVLVLLVLTLGAVPLVFQLWPSLAEWEVLGLPLAWLLLGVVVYPFLLFLGWRYVRRVERNEQDFADLVRDDS